MFDAIGTALSWCYDLTGNYGLAIMLLTLGIMILLTPLTLKGTRSMIAMQRLQPEMKKLQSKYKDDRQKLNEEMLKFYKEHNINPVGGCLPLLLQTPVFIVLYRVLHGLTNPHGYAEDMGRAFGLAGREPEGGVRALRHLRPELPRPDVAALPGPERRPRDERLRARPRHVGLAGPVARASSHALPLPGPHRASSA